MKKGKVVASAIIGNIVEYYDFGIYAVYAEKIGKLFFASNDAFTETLCALCVFAVGFLMRPIGGIVFGHIGDIFGRKVALTASIIGMSLCTLMIGLLPGYEVIGPLAPLLLVIIRLLQGLCIGGEGAGSAIFILEHLGNYKPGLIGSIVMASNMVGTLVANFVGLMILHLLGDSDFSWRIGFFIGGMMGSIGMYMRANLKETPVFEQLKANRKIKSAPLLYALKRHPASVLLVAFVGGTTSAVAYMVRGYFNTFFHSVLHYGGSQTLYFTAFALTTMSMLLPLFGLMADKVGYRKFLYSVSYLLIIFSVPIFMLISNADHYLPYTVLGIFLYSTLAAAICAPAYPYAIGSFSGEFRYSGVAFSWNMGIALFGGTTAAISRTLSQLFPTIAYAPAFYIVMMATMFIIISFLTRNKHVSNLNGVNNDRSND